VLKRVLIANRGEIAVRVIHACRALGIETVAVYSAADRDALHVELADRAVGIGPSLASRSYLNAGSLIGAALITKADAIHPGYGFLAESAAFSQACVDAELTFVGPTPHSIREMADKAQARRVARAMGVPTASGYEGQVHGNGNGNGNDVAEMIAAAQDIGYPLLVKASSGGGGRGMLRVDNADALPSMMQAASAQAKSAFGDGSIYLEKYISNARHVEVQVLGDGLGHAIHLGERDCSIQRRHQKLLEEAPCQVIEPARRDGLHGAAVRLACGVNYAGAGTVEFLVDLDGGKYYFIEMNTRIQVEHPVTEMLTGVDLVREQLLIAAGQGLSLTQSDIKFDGHVIECRINAEDPANAFLPAPGRLSEFKIPDGARVRTDTHCRSGYDVPPFYDSLLAKLIVHGADRRQAIARMRAALSRFVISGVPTTIAFHQALLDCDDFANNHFNTAWLEENIDELIIGQNEYGAQKD
jgi:acetyl-CoA carboxylase biotin carboxylase subunit